MNGESSVRNDVLGERCSGDVARARPGASLARRGEPSVVRGDDVALLLVSQAVGVGKRAERGTHVLQGLRGRSALCTSPAAIPAFEATSGEQSSTLRPPPATGRRLFPLGRPSGEQDSIRSVVPGQETDPRFLRRETLEKPEIENECRRTAVRMEGVSAPFARITCCDVALMWQPPRGPGRGGGTPGPRGGCLFGQPRRPPPCTPPALSGSPAASPSEAPPWRWSCRPAKGSKSSGAIA